MLNLDIGNHLGLSPAGAEILRVAQRYAPLGEVYGSDVYTRFLQTSLGSVVLNMGEAVTSENTSSSHAEIQISSGGQRKHFTIFRSAEDGLSSGVELPGGQAEASETASDVEGAEPKTSSFDRLLSPLPVIDRDAANALLRLLGAGTEALKETELSFLIKKGVFEAEANKGLLARLFLEISRRVRMPTTTATEVREYHYKAPALNVDDNGNVSIFYTDLSDVEQFTPTELVGDASLCMLSVGPKPEEDMVYTNNKLSLHFDGSIRTPDPSSMQPTAVVNDKEAAVTLGQIEDPIERRRRWLGIIDDEEGFEVLASMKRFLGEHEVA